MAGLAMRTMPARGRLITILLFGVVLLAVGYSGGLGSPVAATGSGVPRRGRHAAAQHAQAGTAAATAAGTGSGASAGPNSVARQRPAAANGCRRSPIPNATSGSPSAWSCWPRWRRRPRWPGPAGSPRRAPSTRSREYWHDTADWLDEHNDGGRVLVAPGAPFATQIWGTSHDEPLQVLGNSPWGVRDSIPLTPPETIRALDSVQRLFAAGRPSTGLADTLARQGISYLVVRNDLDPDGVAVGSTAVGAPDRRRVARPDEGGPVR